MFLAADDLADAPLELIERELESLAAGLTAGTARWIELVGEFDRRTGWAETGCRSTSDWVAWRCAVTPRAAREQVRVARRLPSMPLVRAAFATGELSYSKVRALTRLEDVEDEEALLELARHATAAQLERMVCAARKAIARDAQRQHETSFVRWYWDPDDGSLRLTAKLPPEDGVLLVEALEAARAALEEQRRAEDAEERGSAVPPQANDEYESGSAEPPPRRRVTQAEALTALAEAALARPPASLDGLQGGERHQILVHIDAETLATDSPGANLLGKGCSHLARGPGVCPETVRRLCCDGALVPLVELDGVPVAIGARRRTISPALRRALVARDGTCQFPGCECHRYVDAHHIHHWAHGGETALDNLVLLCRHHHRLVHEWGYTLERDGPGGELRFYDPSGQTLERAPEIGPYSGPSLTAGKKLWPGTGEKANRAQCVEAVLMTTLDPVKAPAALAAGAPA